MSRNSPPAEFDVAAGHRKFSALCFNRTWDLLDKADRTPAEDEEMLAATFASLWHWLQREDLSDESRSIGYWQVARVFATLEDGRNAVAWGEKCLATSGKLSPFYRGYAHEAIARGHVVQGHPQQAQPHLTEARRCADALPAGEEKDLLTKDLATLE